MELSQEDLEKLPGNDLNILMDYLGNTLPSIKEDVFDMKIGENRVYVEREGEDLWTIYRLEKDDNTIKVNGHEA
jgi:hypothetical protein